MMSEQNGNNGSKISDIGKDVLITALNLNTRSISALSNTSSISSSAVSSSSAAAFVEASSLSFDPYYKASYLSALFQRSSSTGSDHSSDSRAAKNWKHVAKIATKKGIAEDPWMYILHLPISKGYENEYEVKTHQWRSVPVLIRLEDEAEHHHHKRHVNVVYQSLYGNMVDEKSMSGLTIQKIQLDQVKVPFAQGAMRVCYRSKIMKSTGPGASAYVQSLKWQEYRSFLCTDYFPAFGKRISGKVSAMFCCRSPLVLGDFLDTLLLLKEEEREHYIRYILAELRGDGEEKALLLRESIENAIQGEIEDRKRWQVYSNNIVVKRYKVESEGGVKGKSASKSASGGSSAAVKKILELGFARTQVKDDVIMQEVCKVLAKWYNSRQPPKQIDMLHVGVLEMIKKGKKQIYGLETFLQGDYQKYNNNAGWCNTTLGRIRHTPNCFSFFTWRATQGRIMIVDVQGINDIFTDPQIHSELCGELKSGFGTGDSHTRGMALFLYSFYYECNPIVQYLGLKPFQMYPGERGNPTMEEWKAYEEGKKYLESDEWRSRMEKRSLSPTRNRRGLSASSFDSTEDEETSIRSLASFRLEDILPFESFSDNLNANDLEGNVHYELALLHQNDHEQIVMSRVCDKEKAVRFHMEKAAELGNLKACLYVGRRLEDEQSLNEALELYYHVAQVHESYLGKFPEMREVVLRIARLLTSSNENVQAVSWLELALTLDDGLTDAKRKSEMIETNAEIHAKIAHILEEHEGERDKIIEHLEGARDGYTELGMFKLASLMDEEIGGYLDS